MHINPRDTIADVPIVVARDFLRSILSDLTPDKGWTKDDLARQYGGIGFPILHSGLEAIGYIQKVGDDDHFTITPAGCQFALASAARPIRRATAKRAIQDFLVRVIEVNENPHYLYGVGIVVIFGSYLSNGPTLSDVDIAIELTHKTDERQREEQFDRRIREVIANGKRFNSYLERAFWPFNEVLAFLKSRSRSIQLHSFLHEVANGIITSEYSEPLYLAPEFFQSLGEDDQRRFSRLIVGWHRRHEELLAQAKDSSLNDNPSIHLPTRYKWKD